MIITLPIRTVNTSNSREHWATVAKRAKAHRRAAALAFRSEFRRLGLNMPMACDVSGLTVELTRVGPRPLDDDGNVTSLKAVRDGVADALGLKSDADPRVTWRYAQRRGPPKTYAVEIEVTS